MSVAVLSEADKNNGSRLGAILELSLILPRILGNTRYALAFTGSFAEGRSFPLESWAKIKRCHRRCVRRVVVG